MAVDTIKIWKNGQWSPKTWTRLYYNRTYEI